LLTGAILGFTSTVMDVSAGRAEDETAMVAGVD
jgi:hypothetical protein